MGKFCSNCGNKVNGNADVCLNCGKKIDKTSELKGKNKYLIASGIIMVCLGILSLFILFYTQTH